MIPPYFVIYIGVEEFLINMHSNHVLLQIEETL